VSLAWLLPAMALGVGAAETYDRAAWKPKYARPAVVPQPWTTWSLRTASRSVNSFFLTASFGCQHRFMRDLHNRPWRGRWFGERHRARA